MRFRVVIPARYASQRLPGKLLRDIAGRAMILHVCDRARESDADEVVVATDDERIRDAVAAAGVNVCMTKPSHASGTDRIAEVATMRRWDPDEIVVNVQGDEPLIPPPVIRQVASLLHGRPDAEMATLCTPVISMDEFTDPNVVKVAVAKSGSALYFSRAPIPWQRGDVAGARGPAGFLGSLRHIGLYAYRVEPLLRLAATPPCDVERRERLEQLRALWLGFTIQMDVAAIMPPAGVDTAADLERVTRLLSDAESL